MEDLKIKIIDPDDKRLKQIAIPVTDFTKNYKEILEQMKKVCLKYKAFAAAAPQFGILERFILFMTADKDIAYKDQKDINYIITPYFNPVIKAQRGHQYFYESCMSVPNTMGKVIRPYYIELEAQDINGNKIYKTAEDFEAIICCHEIDHLDGIEYTDKAEDIIRNVNLEERMKIRRLHPHTIIDKN